MAYGESENLKKQNSSNTVKKDSSSNSIPSESQEISEDSEVSTSSSNGIANAEAQILYGEELIKEKDFQKGGSILKAIYGDLLEGRIEGIPPIQNQVGGELSYLLARCLLGLAKCAIHTGYQKEGEQIIMLLKKNHQHDIESLPTLASGISSLELALQAFSNNNEAKKATEDNSTTNNKKYDNNDTTLEKENKGDNLPPPALFDIHILQEKLKKDPNDCTSRYQLAMAYYQDEQLQSAVDECLEIIKIDKHWKVDKTNDTEQKDSSSISIKQEEAPISTAQTLLFHIFASLDPSNPIVMKGRSRLTNLLFR